MDLIEGDGKRKRKTKAKKLKMVIHKDRVGKYVIVDKKKYRIGNKVGQTKLTNFIINKINLPKRRGATRVASRRMTKPSPSVNNKLLMNHMLLQQQRIISNINAEGEKEEKIKNRQNPYAHTEYVKPMKEEVAKPISIPIINPNSNDNEQPKSDRESFRRNNEVVSLRKEVIGKMHTQQLYNDVLNTYKNGTEHYTPDDIDNLSDDQLRGILYDRFARQGYGHNSSDDKGMSNIQIDNILNKYDNYLGCISHNEIHSRILPKIKPKSKGGFVINTDPSSKPGEHWQSVYFDASPGGEAEIDFFDSYGDPIDKTLQRDLLAIANKLNAGTYLKFKENRIRYQNNTSSNCGWFATKFLIDRFRGKPFIDATGFNDVKQGEASINHFKAKMASQHGGKMVTFPYVASFGGSLVDFRQNYPANVQKYVNDTTPIKSLVICREPISSSLNGLLNIVSLGGWNKAKKELGYDKLFHLYFIINGNLKLERNHVVTMGPSSLKSDAERMYVNLPPGKTITIGELLQNTAKLVGPDLQRYDASSRNCQEFIIQVLRANGLLHDAYKTFVLQDVESIFKKVPKYVHWLGQLATDSANKLEELRGNGRGYKPKEVL